MKSIIFLIFVLLNQSLFASDWFNITFREDSENQYWVGVSNPHENLKDATNEAYNEALKDSVKYNYGFNQSIVENYYSSKKDASFQQESSFETGSIQFKGIKPSKQFVKEVNGKFIVFKEIIYPKNEIQKEKNRLLTLNKKPISPIAKISNEEKKFFGLYTIDTMPASSNIVFIDEKGDKFISKSKMENVLPIGRYTLNISQNGFKDITREIIITGEPVFSSIILEKQESTIFFNIQPKDAKILIDGKIIGTNSLILDQGLHEVMISHENYLSTTQMIDVVQTDTISVNLKPKNKSITVITEPTDADVFINGENIGKSPILGKLTKNENIHVSIVKDGYQMENKFLKNINENNDIIKINLNKLSN